MLIYLVNNFCIIYNHTQQQPYPYKHNDKSVHHLCRHTRWKWDPEQWEHNKILRLWMVPHYVTLPAQ